MYNYIVKKQTKFMLTEELKTFISKMRLAGKTDFEIAAELKTAGWEERAINQELSSKTRFNLEKINFWVWLYGIAILSFIASISFGQMVNSHLNVIAFFAEFVVISTMIYAFFIVPIATFLALGFKFLFWVLRFMPHFKDSPSSKQLDHKWLLVVSTAITGAITLSVGYFQARIPNGGMGTLIFVLIAILGGILLILSSIFALVLIAVRKIVRRKKLGFK